MSPWNSAGQKTGVSSQPFSSPGDLPNPRIEPRSPTSQVGSLPAEPQGKPKNTGVGSLSLLQRIFPTQESNRALLHCRWILYQLSYEGSPISMVFYCLLSHIERVTGRKARGLQKLPAKLKLSSLESVSVPRHTLYLFK